MQKVVLKRILLSVLIVVLVGAIVSISCVLLLNNKSETDTTNDLTNSNQSTVLLSNNLSQSEFNKYSTSSFYGDYKVMSSGLSKEYYYSKVQYKVLATANMFNAGLSIKSVEFNGYKEGIKRAMWVKVYFENWTNITDAIKIGNFSWSGDYKNGFVDSKGSDYVKAHVDFASNTSGTHYWLIFLEPEFLSINMKSLNYATYTVSIDQGKPDAPLANQGVVFKNTYSSSTKNNLNTKSNMQIRYFSKITYNFDVKYGYWLYPGIGESSKFPYMPDEKSGSFYITTAFAQLSTPEIWFNMRESYNQEFKLKFYNSKTNSYEDVTNSDIGEVTVGGKTWSTGVKAIQATCGNKTSCSATAKSGYKFLGWYNKSYTKLSSSTSYSLSAQSAGSNWYDFTTSSDYGNGDVVVYYAVFGEVDPTTWTFKFYPNYYSTDFDDDWIHIKIPLGKYKLAENGFAYSASVGYSGSLTLGYSEKNIKINSSGKYIFAYYEDNIVDINFDPSDFSSSFYVTITLTLVES